jgi:hypothetical protein
MLALLSQFMGVMERIASPSDHATVWSRMDGSILMACPTFENWFGYSAKEAQGLPLASIIARGFDELQE